MNSALRTALRTAAVFLAPILLVAIALLQIYRAHTYEQSPWKGGGFGMFSTVDSPGARYLRAFLRVKGVEGIDGDHDLEIPLPSKASREISRLRVIPSQEHLNQLAETIAEVRWVSAEYDPVLALSATNSELPPPGAAGPIVSTSSTNLPSDQPRLRAIRSDEPEPPEAYLIPIGAVRVELRRKRFDGSANRLHTEPMLVATYAPSASEDADAVLP